MFDNIDLKIKDDNVVVSAKGILGKEKIVSIPLAYVKNITWAKEVKDTLVAALIKKGYGKIAVELADKKINPAKTTTAAA